MRSGLAALLAPWIMTVPAQATEIPALVNLQSMYDVSTTADRLESVLQDKGMTVFARIDHAAGAQKVGKALRPTELIIFGNPKVGTSLMQCDPLVGIELPQKVLIWEDNVGGTWFTYNNPAALGGQYQLTECQAVLSKIEQALAKFAQAATAK